MWSHKNNDYVKSGTPNQGEVNHTCHCVYLGDLQQYNTVLDGLYHTLEEKDRKGINCQELTSKLKGRKEHVLTSDLHKWSLSSFQFSERRKTGCKIKQQCKQPAHCSEARVLLQPLIQQNNKRTSR